VDEAGNGSFPGPRRLQRQRWIDWMGELPVQGETNYADSLSQGGSQAAGFPDVSVGTRIVARRASGCLMHPASSYTVYKALAIIMSLAGLPGLSSLNKA
jgi:hypothetical protein